MTYRLASGVSWRCWHDGCVVFSAATAQTLLLSPEFHPALAAAHAPERAQAVADSPAGPAAPSAEPDEALFGRLAELGILEPLA